MSPALLAATSVSYLLYISLQYVSVKTTLINFNMTLLSACYILPLHAGCCQAHYLTYRLLYIGYRRIEHVLISLIGYCDKRLSVCLPECLCFATLVSYKFFSHLPSLSYSVYRFKNICEITSSPVTGSWHRVRAPG